MNGSPMTIPAPVTTLTPGENLIPEGHDRHEYVHTLVALTALVAQHDVMTAVLASKVPSDTPDEPVLLRICPDDLMGRYEIADGHHRVATAIRTGKTEILADIDIVGPDEEPYAGPYFNFAALNS